jgi:hypothetical protein
MSNPGPDAHGPQVSVEISDVQLLDTENDSARRYVALLTVRSSRGVIWRGNAYVLVTRHMSQLSLKVPNDFRPFLGGG